MNPVLCAAALLLLVLGARPALAQAPAAAACAPVDGLSFVCGLDNAEDLVAVPGGRWIVASAYKDNGAGLYLIDARARTAGPAALSVADKAGAAPYAGCPAPDLKALRTHGIELRPGKRGVHTVYAINHQGRESIEVFRLDVRGPAPKVEWIGCLIPPPGVESNGVVALAGGALAVSKFRNPGDPQSFIKILGGQVTGTVYLWRPGQGFSEVPGTRYSGDNGVLASPDGKWLYLADYGNSAIRRIAFDGSAPTVSVATASRPDNLCWVAGGRMLVTGQHIDVANRTGLHGWSVEALDPKTMTIAPVLERPGHAEFDNATTAVLAGGKMWLGTFAGDRVAYLPPPKGVR